MKRKHSRASRSARRKKKPAGKPAPAATPVAARAATAAPEAAVRSRVPRRASALMRRIFTKNDPVKVATKLLDGKGGATAGRVYLQLLEYLYGKPVQPVEARESAAAPAREPFDFICHIPAQKSPGGQASRAAAPANVSTTGLRASGSAQPGGQNDSHQEDEHE